MCSPCGVELKSSFGSPFERRRGPETNEEQTIFDPTAICQIEWTSAGLDTPIAINLLGPQKTPESPSSGEGGDEGGGRDDETDEDNGDGTALTATERSLRPAAQLGSGLPTAGSFLAALGPALGPASSRPRQADLPPGDGYRIEVSPPPYCSCFFYFSPQPVAFARALQSGPGRSCLRSLSVEKNITNGMGYVKPCSPLHESRPVQLSTTPSRRNFPAQKQKSARICRVHKHVARITPGKNRSGCPISVRVSFKPGTVLASMTKPARNRTQTYHVCLLPSCPGAGQSRQGEGRLSDLRGRRPPRNFHLRNRLQRYRGQGRLVQG